MPESSDIHALKFTNLETSVYLNQIRLLREVYNTRSTINAQTETFIKENIGNLIGFVPFLSTTVHFGEPFERVVINRYVREDKRNCRLQNISQIKYPPPEVARHLSYNRANLPGVSTFYAGHGMMATALETNPKIGDLYTTSAWQQKEGMRISYLPIFHKEELFEYTTEFIDDWNNYVDFLGQLDSNVRKIVSELYEFITDAFLAPINPNNKIEYIFSAVFADFFMHHPDFGVDALYYPSVPSRYISSNLALKPGVLESHFELVDIHESVCIGSRESGTPGWMSHRTGTAISPSISDIEINWRHELPPENDLNTHKIIRDFNVEFE